VTLIGRARHVNAIRAAGLRLETQRFDERVSLDASSAPASVAGAELVLCCVKSSDTETAGREIAPHLAAGTVVLSLQNGVDNAARLAAQLERPVIPTVVYVATEMAGAGHVRHHGRGELVLGASAESARIAASFTAAGVPASISENVTGELWAKLVLNCAYNALSALTQFPYGVLREQAGVELLMRGVVAECLTVARAAGVRVPGDAWEGVERIAQTMPRQLSSTAQDVARGKPSEIDHLNGFVAREGERLGVATSLNRALHTLVKGVEQRALWAAYRETRFEAQAPAGVIYIRAGERTPALDALLDAHRAESWCFVTAWNPASETLPLAANRLRNAELAAALDALGVLARFDGVGRPTAGDWTSEESFLALGVDRPGAMQLGRRFGQNAVVWGRRGALAELLDCRIATAQKSG
jgi:2-dehydropantoate 2-reductase